MRVLLLADSLGNGGLERQLALLAENLPGHCEGRVWTMGRGPFYRHLVERGVTVCAHERRARMDPSPALSLWSMLHAWRPDVVHTWSWISGLLAAPGCRALRIPLVNGLIRSGDVDLTNLRLKHLGLALSTLVVANTQVGLRSWDVPPAKGRVVHNGFDTTRLPSSRDGSHDHNEGVFVVVMTGRMTPVKHFGLVLEAARLLASEEAGWRFLLVGDGPDRARLVSLSADLVERGVVVFPEPGVEVLGIVRDADVGVLMTDPKLAHEGLSNSIMEYMACGLPVVCGDGGGNPELVLDGVTGSIVQASDVVALADGLRYLREHPSVRESMGRAGRERILRDFSVSRMVDGMLAVYEEAIDLTTARRSGPYRPMRRD